MSNTLYRANPRTAEKNGARVFLSVAHKRATSRRATSQDPMNDVENPDLSHYGFLVTCRESSPMSAFRSRTVALSVSEDTGPD